MTTIPATTCPTELGQIQRFILVRRSGLRWDTVDITPTGKSTPTLLATGSYAPTVSAGWTALNALTDDDKTLFTPLIGGDATITTGEAITFGGGDNSTLNGETYHIGFNPSDGVARFDSLTAAQTSALKELVCESLEIYFINDDGDIIGERDTLDADLWHGFNVKNFTLKGRNVAGFATRDSNEVSFQLDDDWDTKFEKQTPTDFNALTAF
jgi:hypothetical protein